MHLVGLKQKPSAKRLPILFKAAMFGEDLSWGNITAVIGSVEHQFDPSIINIYMEDIQVMKNG